MIKKVRIIEEEKGSAIVLFTFLFLIITGVAGLVIDGGVLYNTKSHLKKTANAAVLSGVQELTNSDEAVNKVVYDILDSHGEVGSIKNIIIKPDNKKRLKVDLEKEVPLYFLKLFNINSLKIKVSSTAALNPMNKAEGAVPLGIDETIPLEYLKEYTLKVDSGDSNYGNFGVLALSGPGAKLYEEDLRNGFSGELSIGDVVDTQTGNIEGKTRDAVNFRLNSCPYSIDDFSHRDCPRVMMILVYKPYSIESNQMKQVNVTGFAYFYIKTPMNTNDSTIKGYFIKRAGTGYGDESVTDKGAYAIRLIE